MTPAVLIPRPETEVLVEIALAILRSSQSSRHNVCDVGTGSGCIAVSIAYELASAHLIATDVSLDALQVARRNARQHAVQDRVNLIAADLLPFSSRPRFDLVVSNPPYVAAPSIGSLEPELRFEPRAALDGGVDGLDTIRRLLAQARAVLISNGWLVMEIGADQSHAAQELAVANNFVNVDVRADYAGLPRVLVAQAS